jgi:carbon monoxide dehydrogenase subunit G
MNVKLSERIEIEKPPAIVFDAAAGDYAAFAAFFPGYGVIPRINKIQLELGTRLEEGSVRLIHNSDGSVLRESVEVLRRPTAHVYVLSGFVFPFSLLVRKATGSWVFEPAGQGTRVVWNYDFELTSFLAWPVAAPVILIFFRGAMRRCLGLIRARLMGN